MYRDAGEDPISFGDIFEGEHLIDVYAVRETRALGGGPMPRGAAERLSKQVNRDLTDLDSEQLAVYTPAMTQHADKYHALARGSNVKLPGRKRAILLTDSCAADTALAVDRHGRRKRGRLQFAPVIPAAADDVAQLIDQPVFGRFPLEACDAFQHGAIAELRYAFHVDVATVDDRDRILGLTDDAAEELEVAWSACTLRRGPLATARNVERLADRIAASPVAAELDGVADLIGEVVDLGWLLESELDAVAEAETFTPELRTSLELKLRALEASTRDAANRLANGDAR